MAVAWDATGAGNVQTGAGASPMSWTHTASGTNRCVIVVIAVGSGGHGAASGYTRSATYDGVTMTSLGAINSNNGTTGFVELFYLLNPNTGAKTVTVTDNQTQGSLIGNSVSYTGVASVSAETTGVTSVGNTPSLAVSSAVGRRVIAAFGTGSAAASPTQTQLYLNNHDTNSSCGNLLIMDAAGAATVTFGAAANADNWALIGLDLLATPTTADSPAPPLIIPNRHVGPMALREAFRRPQRWGTGPDNYNATTTSTVTVGLTADGVIGVVGDSSTTITATATAAGTVGTVTGATTAATVGLSAAGTVDELHPAPPLIIPNRYVGPMALREAFRRPQRWGTGPDNYNATTTSIVTVGLTADGVIGAVGDTSTTITATATSAGTVGTVTGATTTVTVGLTAAGVVGTSTGATTAITVGLTAAGVVGTSTGASTAITVGLTADGAVTGAGVDTGIPATPLIIPNRYVGPMALRKAFRRAQHWGTGPDNFNATTTSTTVAVGLTAAGVVGAVGDTSTTITAALTAAGVVGAVTGATTAITVTLTAAGVVGTVTGAATTVTVGLTAAGVVGVVGDSSTVITVGLSAASTFDAGAPAAPLRIPNRHVGPTVLRQLFRRAYWPVQGVIDLPGTSTTTTVTVGLTAAGVVGTTTGASTAVTVGLTAAGVVGTTTGTSTAVTVGLTAAGRVGITTTTASMVVTVGLTAAGAVGLSGQSIATAVTVGRTAAGNAAVTGVGDAASLVVVGLFAAGVVTQVGPPAPERIRVVGVDIRGFLVLNNVRRTNVRGEIRTVAIPEDPAAPIAVP